MRIHAVQRERIERVRDCRLCRPATWDRGGGEDARDCSINDGALLLTLQTRNRPICPRAGVEVGQIVDGLRHLARELSRVSNGLRVMVMGLTRGGVRQDRIRRIKLYCARANSEAHELTELGGDFAASSTGHQRLRTAREDDWRRPGRGGCGWHRPQCA